MNQLMKVPYRVIFCSGEDPEYPISNLICDLNNGWQSIRFPTYPQILLIQFLSPDVTVREMKVTAHQAKISKYIEIFACSLADVHKEINKIKFRKIGEMRFSDNHENNYQLRELQTAHTELKASYIKFVFHENFENSHNPFSQIGILNISIKANSYILSPYLENIDKNLTGNTLEIVNEGLIGGNNEKGQLPLKFPDLNYSYKTLLASVLDEKSSRRYKMLEMEKKQAVEREDFDKATILKTQIDQLLFYGPYAVELQKRMDQALVHDDFDTIKILKAELQRMQNNLKSKQFLKGGLILRQESSKNKPNEPFKIKEETNVSKQNFTSSLNLSPPKKASNDLKIEEETHKTSLEMKFRSMSPIKNQSAAMPKIFNTEPSQKDQKDQKDQHIFPDNKTENSMLQEPKGMPPIEEAPDINDPLDEPTAEQKALCSPFIGFLGEEICFKLFNEKWQKREIGLLDLEKRVIQDADFKKSLNQGSSSLNLILKLFGILFKDKVIKIVIIALELLKKVLDDEACKNKVIGNEFTNLDGLWESLLDKIGDNCLKITQFSREIFCVLTKQAGAKQNNQGIMALVKELDKEKAKNSLSLKHLEEKLKLLAQLIKEQNNLTDNVLASFAHFCLKNVEHQKNTIRDLAFKVLEDMKGNYGEEKLRKVMGDISRRVEIKLFS